jgi:hypothetical protein
MGHLFLILSIGFEIDACEMYSHVQAQLECSASNAKTCGSCCEGWVDWTRRIVGSWAELLVSLLHLTHVICLRSAYEDIMS